MVKLIGGIFLIIGLAVSSAGGYFYLSTQDFLNTGLRSSGKVVEMRKAASRNIYTPVVQFETADHRTVTAPCLIGSNPPTHKLADSVTVIYRTQSPEEFRLDEPLELWFLTWLFGGIGLVFVMIGGGMLAFS